MKLLLVFLIGYGTSVLGQTFVPNPDKWIEYVEELGAEAENPEQVEVLYEELSYLVEHPMDINRVTAAELSRLPFLSDRQIEEILSFRKRVGEILTLYVLKVIDGMDFPTIELLLPFVYVNDEAERDLPSYGQHELRTRYDRNLKGKDGEKYLGEPFYHSLQYAYSLDKRLYAGFSAEKDAGEPFRRGYDFYSGYVFLSEIKSYLGTFVIGDYKASFGQGLVIHNGFNAARSSPLTQSGKRSNGFRRHSSTNESDYLRGVAATFCSGFYLEYSLFYSLREMDATLTSDSTFSAFKTDGLHRLPRDYEKRHTVRLQTFGANACYAGDRFGIGLTALAHTTANLSLQPDVHPYNLFYFRGSRNANASCDYYLQLGNARFYGETALSLNLAFATLHAVHFTPSSDFNLLILHRSYSPRYQALYASAFSQNSDVRNETGLFTSFSFLPVSHWMISGCLDFFRHPWLRYGVSAPSSGKEYRMQVDYKPASDFSVTLRYKYRQREKDQDLPYEQESLVRPYATQRLRLQFHYGKSAPFAFRTAVDAVRYQDAVALPSKGVAFSQTLAWHPGKLPVQLDLYAVLFRTDNYDSRITSYEKQILYNLYTTMLYGHGYRLVALLRWDILPHLTLSARLAHATATDLHLMLRLRL
ncbi:MAG: helix-hairpin-helix domain-containing protein [Tannerellaceae bacterium]|jgi:hypothetical protein|nr:helix-hairpin-helix domain-containing protein [Tannerellaceae bacterium]